MEWLKDLYLGDKAAEKEKDLVRRIGEGYWVPGAYVIALANNRRDLLDIIPAFFLVQKYYTDNSELKIIGLGASRSEAMGLIPRIIEDVYKAAGNYDVQAYFRENKIFR